MSEQRIPRAEDFLCSLIDVFSDRPIALSSASSALVHARDAAIIEAACAAVCFECAVAKTKLVQFDGDWKHETDAAFHGKPFKMHGACVASPIRESLRSLLEPGK